MKRGHDDDQVELAGALTSLRTEPASTEESSSNVNNRDCFTGPAIEKHHVTWIAWAKYLDDYCQSNGVRIGIEFTDSTQKRNDEMRNSKRAKDGKFVRYLPGQLEAYRRSYVCHLGRKGRTRDVKFRRTACPFKLIAKSVYSEDKWEVEVTCPNAEHIHSETTGSFAALKSVESDTLLKSQAQAFPVEGLKGSPASRKVLTDMISRCKRMPENETVCTKLLKRLETLHDSVAVLEEENHYKLAFTDVVVRFVKLMHRKPLLLRLATCQTVLFKIQELQDQLNDVTRALKLNTIADMMEPSETLESAQADQFTRLNEFLSEASDRVLINEFHGAPKLYETLMILSSGMKWEKQSDEMLALQKSVFERVTAILPEFTSPDWFIPWEDLECEERLIGEGTFGEVRRGTWLHYGKPISVVVKLLYKEIDGYSSDVFRNELDSWHKLTVEGDAKQEDNHILRVFGGSCTTPQYYVCEYAEGGNLRQFLGKDVNRTHFWRMFQQTAQTLQLLHLKEVPHGALNCSNILVGANNSVKLTDFGFGDIRALSSSLSGDAEVAIANSVRWKPKERLVQSSTGTDQFKADIYALGMCMIEARTQQEPFANMDNTQVLDVILKGELPRRPDSFSDTEWDLICKLCNADHVQRPSLVEVIKKIENFAEEEQQLELAA
ncbi:Serine/threonine-protein kinase-transforming protein Rmil [Phytophthora citrophthora]|uniref:Serine/threonine-protein kinase-transforming protein Rmil n=1 Tax=Phytophthora citrophthora TaxID=4793 RepID=A0AAD9LBY1_9STRA|nr:Serine/threonine-protein kinase-transforming protein Rmil [Phytophthora citrophthora]